ncbi:hypothetical protein KY330_05315 [Candidatus Woesearchaeota archaeon]|nr:hypothetical protein [Candidatus Woesearchaeota archaeon]
MKYAIILVILILIVSGCDYPFESQADLEVAEFLEQAVNLPEVKSVCSEVPLAERDDCLVKNCPLLKTEEGREECCNTIKDVGKKGICKGGPGLFPEVELDDYDVKVSGTMPAGLKEGESISIYIEYVRPGGKFSELPDAMYTFCRGGVGKNGQCFNAEQNLGMYATKTLIASNEWDTRYPITEYDERVYLGPVTDQWGDTTPAATEYRIITTWKKNSEDETKLWEFVHEVRGPFTVS